MLRYIEHWADRKETHREVIDLRSPGEFALGHIPGAQNIPLLDNDERHQVGTLYKNAGKSEAVHAGLEIFAAKAERFLQQVEELSPQHQVLLYCWRGGMRSRLVGSWLAFAGFDVCVLRGGYKVFRRDVLKSLDAFAEHPKIVLNGRTGSGKTRFLHQVSNESCAIIDFEALACHRGSAFGDLGQKQSPPTQQNFENQIYAAYVKLCGSTRILVEIESYLGPVRLPSKLRASILQSPMIFLSRDFEDRVGLLMESYCTPWTTETEAQFFAGLYLVKKYLSGEDQSQVIADITIRNFSAVISKLLHLHYDRAYDKSLKRHKEQAIANFNLSHEQDVAIEFTQKILNGKILPREERA